MPEARHHHVLNGALLAVGKFHLRLLFTHTGAGHTSGTALSHTRKAACHNQGKAAATAFRIGRGNSRIFGRFPAQSARRPTPGH